ncbi:hypothetical protein A2454_00325 [Candidatus Peribacteria bacterium RIFOXYC2_FULL_55_14]|nr:MAG: Tetratricopeptide [Candidatus Peribacteria bacterium GW2011_GWC2_54_8]OGJ73120.1 MAG: hypothetical protein A2198_03115 [Candidatus Peribacteria bacterium RIFOXYA1_FULL_56_14]OGJ73889.1 MAG: hypothetical protein A2217_04090 [Candidatus Peribacteria bacterium RIFOXYA2_FULL_55_28]OGJ75732.1 MAG: hypothetical protein A2384_05560 [Candidatus Peribacteria bacterium RIFOXYB1_FULL_54_35]OGJ76653.1 MAG: hypothetical protein A2327_02775 [Candidatus Peribacteria bacterium RIFOXYB2_FULL_54_17]OGJ7
MAEPPAGTQAQSGLIIPDDIRQKFPELIELILQSESMNDEERQYWINILPIMTPDQIENLRGILQNEKEQLAAIDNKYSKQIEQMGQEELIRRTEVERRGRRTQLQSDEATHSAQDEEQAEELLKQIESA